MRIENIKLTQGIVLSGAHNSFVVKKEKVSNNQSKEINLNTSPANLSYLVKFGQTNNTNGKINKDEDSFFIKNVFDVQENQVAPDDKNLNPKGLRVKVVKSKGNKKDIFITNGKDELIAAIKVNSNATNLPEVKYYQGKFDPTLEITTKAMKDENMRIKMFAGSKMKGDNWSIVMPGTSVVEKRNGELSEVSFGTNKKGEKRTAKDLPSNVYLTTLFHEEKVYNSTKDFLANDKLSGVTPGKLGNLAKEMGVSLIYPAGGLGTRFFSMHDGFENKVSTNLPTNSEHRMMHTAIYAGLKGGFFDNDDRPVYLSQKHNLEEADDVHHIDLKNAKGTDGLAIKRALEENLIPRNKPALVVNTDGISNYYFPYVLKYYQELGDAAAIIPYTIVPAKEAKSYGLIGIKPSIGNDVSLKNGEGIYEIAHFAEKPKYLLESEIPTINDVKPKKPVRASFESDADYEKAMNKYENKLAKFNENNADVIKGISEYEKSMSARYKDSPESFYSNPGVYLFSPAALKVLRKSDDKDTGLGGSLMPKLVELAKKGELKDENGRELKVYTVPMLRIDQKEARWNDVGSVQAYMKEVKEIAHQTAKHGVTTDNPYYGLPEYLLKDFTENADLQTGVIFMSQNAKDKFNDWAVDDNVVAEGNVLITDLPTKTSKG